MKKYLLLVGAAFMMCYFASCAGGKKADDSTKATETKAEEMVQLGSNSYSKDAEGWITIFNGKDFTGWRGYNKTTVPARWTIDEGAIKFNGSGGGEAQEADGGDLIFAHKFKNFELSFEWRVAKGSNSGLFILAQEVEGLPIYYSSPEYQILDNENHPDARMGKDGNRMAASLYDMIPANPQNAKPFGEWNKGGIMCFKGTIVHYQNDATVLEYHMWTDHWKSMIDNSKFAQGGQFPEAYDLLINCGGANREGYIGFQDHGDDVWFRNIKVKILD